MGRLFWKFFLSILLAQLAATVGIGGAVWLKNREQAANPTADLDTSPPAEMAINSAAATLQYGGVKALQSLLADMERHRVYAVDDTGHELLGRIVSPAMLNEARYLLKKEQKWRVVRQLSDADGKHYLLFLPSPAHQRGLDADARPMMPMLEGAALPAPPPPPGESFGPGRDGARAPGGADTHGGPASPDSPGGHAGHSGPSGQADPRSPASPDVPGRPGGPGGGHDGGPGNPHFRPLTPWVPIVAAVLASTLFAVLLAWYFSRPIRALRQAFEAAAGGDLAPRFNKKSGIYRSELNDLGRDFDRMAARLRNLIDGQTRLLHDVSHELRSPLARLQAAIGLAHQQPDKTTASLERIERESVRMDKLVGELLTLSRLEVGALSAAQEEISMAELLDQIVGDAAYEAASQQRSVVMHGEADMIVSGHADLLARAIENVVRNAIKHSPEGGEVQIDVQPQAHQLRIRVLDSGPGVADADLADIFRPFFRSSSACAEGHGLGLAIAQQVVLAHSGTIHATNRPEGGLCVELTLPTVQQRAPT